MERGKEEKSLMSGSEPSSRLVRCLPALVLLPCFTFVKQETLQTRANSFLVGGRWHNKPEQSCQSSTHPTIPRTLPRQVGYGFCKPSELFCDVVLTNPSPYLQRHEPIGQALQSWWSCLLRWLCRDHLTPEQELNQRGKSIYQWCFQL